MKDLCDDVSIYAISNGIVSNTSAAVIRNVLAEVSNTDIKEAFVGCNCDWC